MSHETMTTHHGSKPTIVNAEPTGIDRYRPVLYVAIALLGIISLQTVYYDGFELHRAMNTFMGCFFLIFAVAKLVDIKGFAESFAMYDLVAKRSRIYGLAYPFIELVLGMAYLGNLFSLQTNVVTAVIAGVGLVGVSHSLLKKEKLHCACLGSRFNLPLSSVALIEDGLMLTMALTMIYLILTSSSLVTTHIHG